jgi:hypothetical protein
MYQAGLSTEAEEMGFVTEKILFRLRQELRLKKQSSSLIDFKLPLLFQTDICYKYFATMPRNLIVCIKSMFWWENIQEYNI